MGFSTIHDMGTKGCNPRLYASKCSNKSFDLAPTLTSEDQRSLIKVQLQPTGKNTRRRFRSINFPMVMLSLGRPCICTQEVSYCWGRSDTTVVLSMIRQVPNISAKASAHSSFCRAKCMSAGVCMLSGDTTSNSQVCTDNQSFMTCKLSENLLFQARPEGSAPEDE